jgi:hypothetical protein
MLHIHANSHRLCRAASLCMHVAMSPSLLTGGARLQRHLTMQVAAWRITCWEATSAPCWPFCWRSSPRSASQEAWKAWCAWPLTASPCRLGAFHMNVIPPFQYDKCFSMGICYTRHCPMAEGSSGGMAGMVRLATNSITVQVRPPLDSVLTLAFTSASAHCPASTSSTHARLHYLCWVPHIET